MNTLTLEKEEVKKVANSAEKKETLKVENPKQDKKTTFEDKKKELEKILNPMTAEQRIKNADNFRKLAQRHQFLREKQDDLASYLVGRDGLKEKVIIQCDGCRDFEISNSHIIEEILNICNDKLENLIKTSESEILTFNI